MTAHIVSVSRSAYNELVENMAPECRWVDIHNYPGLTHIWFYAPNGDVVVVTPDPIKKLPSTKVEAFNATNS
jgi:hypothetical protein